MSPEGGRIAAHVEDADGGDVWLLDLNRQTRQRFTFDASQHNSSPVWSPDGSRIAFASVRGGMWGLYEKPSSGTGQEKLLFESATPKAPTGFGPDGRSLMFVNRDPKTHPTPYRLWAVSGDGQRFFIARTIGVAENEGIPLTVVLNWRSAL